MKKVILICPDKRPSLEALTGGVPLALAIYLGKPLIEHAFDGLAKDGVTEVLLLVSDRPSEVRDYVGDGSAWGVNVRISPESSELSVPEAATRHAAFEHDAVLLLDSLPQAPKTPIIQDAETWHHSRKTLLPLLAPNQIGAREVSPGIWYGIKARVSSTAVLHPPCWIGPNSMVGAQAIVGPHGYVESDSVIDAHATVENSTVGPRTYLGGMTHLGDSVAAGPVLVNWRNGSLTRLTDAFLLSRLDPPQEALSSLLGRFLAILALLLTSPLLLLALLGRTKHEAVLPSAPGDPLRSVHYYEISSLPGKLRRLPYLWRIVTGHFLWTGNPPLTPEEAELLDGEFERLWLQAGPGIFTAPEAEGCAEPWCDTARAHAALFASQPTTGWRKKILSQGMKNFLT